MTYANLGTISHGTLRPQDLAQSYLSALSGLAKQEEDEPSKARIERLIDKVQGVLDAYEQACDELSDAQDPAAQRAQVDKLESELASYVNEELHEMLQGYAPPLAYFGSHPGDGSDMGFWIDRDALQDYNLADNNVLKVDAGDEWPENAEEFDYVLEVTDHGNATLYEVTSKKEVWSIV